MTKLLSISFILTILLLSSCASVKPQINENFKRDDLNPALADSVDLFIGEAYRMNPEYTNDFIVAIIRANTLNVENARVYYPTLISLISLERIWIKAGLCPIWTKRNKKPSIEYSR